MLNRFHLVLKVNSHHARIKKILTEEHFDYQFGRLKQETGDVGYSTDVVIVTCMDFHDIGVVLEKLAAYVMVSCYFLDSCRAIFKYDTHNRIVSPLGLTYEGTIAPSYNSHLIIGVNTFNFWENI